MSAFPSHPVAAPVDLKAGAVPKVLNLAEAAAFMRCSRAHLCNVIHHKVPGVPHLPSVRIGGRVLFRRESLEQWLQTGRSPRAEEIRRLAEIRRRVVPRCLSDQKTQRRRRRKGKPCVGSDFNAAVFER
jgi:excisionase family DNA binding protein